MGMTSRGLWLWLFVVDLGLVFGAGLYEARISVTRWISTPDGSEREWHPEEARRDDVGRRFWAYATTFTLTLLTLGNLWAARQSSGPIRIWWLTAALTALGDRIGTFSYFIPRMIGLLRMADSPVARAAAAQWARLNYFRLALVLVSWLAALQAFSLLHQSV
jgi:hypothetical protein